MFCKANKDDAVQMTSLINSAYRGEFSRKGWTTEADLLDGSRTDLDEILSLIADDNSMFILCKQNSELHASVYLHNTNDGVHIGMLAVNPLLQGQGIGKALLEAAEIAAQHTWSANRFIMEVISYRHELLAFYQRRGYRHTGISRVFPVNPALWTPKVPALQLVLLEKIL